MEKPSYNQIQDQYNSGHKEATVLVPERGTVRVASTWGESSGEGRTIVTYGNGDNAKLMHAKNEDLTDEGQERLAAELAGKALRSTGDAAEVSKGSEEVQIEQELNNLKEKYGDKSMELWLYASGKMNQQEYQQDGDAASAKGEEQKAGQALLEIRKLGPEAVQDADRYLQLMRQLRKVRQ